MENIRDNELAGRVSWGSVMAGVVTVIAVSLLLTTLGTSLGLSMLSPQSGDVVNGADKAVLAWSVISVVISLALGGFVSGRLAAKDGVIHGFLSWATSLLVASVLGFAAAGSIISFAGSAAGSVASAAGAAAGGIGSAAGKAAGGIPQLSEDIAGRLGLDTRLSAQQGDRQVTEALEKTGIRELQPEYLQSQLEAAGKDLAGAVKNLAVNPDNSDAILDELGQKLKSRVDTASKGVDRDTVKKSLAQNTSLTPEEADKAVDNFISGRDKTINEFSHRIARLEETLKEAKEQYAAFKQQAREKADAAARAGAKIALWSFIGLLAGAVVSALAGLWGVNTHPGSRKIRA